MLTSLNLLCGLFFGAFGYFQKFAKNLGWVSTAVNNTFEFGLCQISVRLLNVKLIDILTLTDEKTVLYQCRCEIEYLKFLSGCRD